MENTGMNQKEKRNHYIEAGYLLLSAFAILFVVSRSSLLYPCNDWNDANSYFSVGKGLFHGKVPYRDIFDQKGMYLYFFYGLAYLVSHTTFAGVFVLEFVLAVADLFSIYQILSLYLKKDLALLLSPLPLAAAFVSNSFYYGGSAEEICLPFLLAGLYLILRYFKEAYPEKVMDRKTVFLGGLLAGMVANIKFTVLGFFFAWMMCIAIAFLVKKDLKGAFKACGFFLLGMFLPFIPWIIYFALHHALYDWYWGYVYINVFAYSNLNGEGPGLGERIYTLAKLLYWVARKNFCYFVFVIPGVLWYLLPGKKKRILPAVTMICLCFFLFLGIYVGGSELPYYALPLSVFTPLGFILLGKVLERIRELAANRRRDTRTDTEAEETVRQREDVPASGSETTKENTVCGNGRRKEQMGSVTWLVWSAAILVVMEVLLCSLSMNFPFHKIKKEDHFLYKLAAVVEQEEDPTLLNIGCLDAGLYTVCDIVPTCQWFQTQTVIMDTVLSEQERYIREGQIQFVLARDAYPDVIFERYELAAEEDWTENGQDFTYYLFRRKD